MKQTKRLAALLLSLVMLLGLPLAKPKSEAAYAGFSVNFGYFHNTLSPYGNWVNVGTYGPVWRPANMAYGWQPYYSNGNWVYTQYGWTWVSNDPWASVAYHYGSWYNDPSYGWVWVPGYTWAPSWVTWQYTNNYVGWAPIPPGFNLSFNWGNNAYPYGYPYGGYQGGYYGYSGQPIVVNRNYYVFVPAQNITSTSLNTVRVPVTRNVEILRTARPATTLSVVNNTLVNHGPRVAGLERFTRTPQQLEQIHQARAIQPQQVQIERGAKQARLQVSAPEVNRAEASRVIKDFNREETAARADRERQLQRANVTQRENINSVNARSNRANEENNNNVRNQRQLEQSRNNDRPAQLQQQQRQLQRQQDQVRLQDRRSQAEQQHQQQQRQQQQIMRQQQQRQQEQAMRQQQRQQQQRQQEQAMRQQQRNERPRYAQSRPSGPQNGSRQQERGNQRPSSGRFR